MQTRHTIKSSQLLLCKNFVASFPNNSTGLAAKGFVQHSLVSLILFYGWVSRPDALMLALPSSIKLQNALMYFTPSNNTKYSILLLDDAPDSLSSFSITELAISILLAKHSRDSSISASITRTQSSKKPNSSLLGAIGNYCTIHLLHIDQLFEGWHKINIILLCQ